MDFQVEVQRMVTEISRRMAALGEDGPSPDFWTLVGSRLAEEARRLGVDRIALMIAVQSALADQQEDSTLSPAMADLLAPLRGDSAHQGLLDRAQNDEPLDVGEPDGARV